MAQFWRSLIDVREEYPVENNSNHGFLFLPPGVWLLGRVKLGSALLIRRCYKDLFQLFFPNVAQAPPGERGEPSHDLTDIGDSGAQTPSRFRDEPSYVVTGNPGIGKTMFIAYVLWRARHAGITVVYEPASPELYTIRYLLRPDGTCRSGSVRAGLFEDELSTPGTWYITDAHAPQTVDVSTILVTSPRKRVYHELLKVPNTSKWFMPVWSWEEIEVCCRYCFDEPKMLLSRAAELFIIFGGIPRIILDKAMTTTNELLINDLHMAVGNCSLEYCRHSIGEITAEDEFPYPLLLRVGFVVIFPRSMTYKRADNRHTLQKRSCDESWKKI